MGVASSTVLDFTQGASSAALKVIVSPSSIGVGDNMQVTLYAGDAYTLFSPYANASRQGSYGIQEFQEDININGSATVTTNFPIASLSSAVYLTPIVNTKTRSIVATAGQTAQVDIINSAIALDGADLVGTIRIKYKTYAEQTYKLTAFTAAGLYVVFYKKDSDTQWTPLTLSVGDGQPDENSQPSIVTIQARDFCTDLPIPGAQPFINNSLIGTADINGKVVAGLLASGAYSIKIQADGYIPTDADELTNDSFIV